MATTPDFLRIADRSTDGYFRHRADRGLVYVNPGFCQLLNHSYEDFKANPPDFSQLIASEDAAEFEALAKRIMRGQVSQSGAVLRMRRSDQSQVWVEIFVVPVMDGDGQIVGLDGVIRDVSEHLLVADLLSKRSLELSALLEAQKALVGSLDFEATLQTIAEQAKRLLNAGLSAIFLPDEEGQYIQPQALVTDMQIDADELKLLIGEGISGWVVAHGTAQCVDRLSEDSRGRRLLKTLGSDAGLAAVPLIIGDEVAGSLTIIGQESQYSDEDVQFLEALAQVAALALTNSQNYSVIAQQATLDGLTGAYNRLFLEEGLEAEIKRADRMGYPLSLMMVDVNDLKVINDEHGHLVGDNVLIHLVSILQHKTRETDWVARYGGDEFVVVLPGCPELVLNRLSQQIQTGLHQGSSPLPYSVSIGGAVRQPGTGGVQDLLQRADEAERSAKEGDGNGLSLDRPGGK